jgi:hypothetical protein
MFMIIQNLSGFSIINRLPNDTRMNSDYFVINILILFEQAIFPRGRELHQKRLMIHLDNYAIHTNRASTNWLDKHGKQCILYLPYLSGLPPNDFHLFPRVNEKTRRDLGSSRAPVF